MFGLELVGEGFGLMLDGQRIGPVLTDAEVEALVGVLMARPRDWLGVEQALLLCEQMGKPITGQGLRMALARGQIAGAYKESVSGRAKTDTGGQWRMPRAAFLAWLAGRR